MKNLLLFIAAIFLGISLYGWFVVRPRVGESPEGLDLERIKASPQYDTKKDMFVNKNEALFAKAHKNINRRKILWRLFFPQNESVPKVRLPDKSPDIREFLAPSEHLKLVWLGHSTFFVNFNGKVILFDPVFSKAGSPIGFINKRFQKPAIALADMPEIDYIVISHDHYDHLDMETIQFFKDKKAKFIVPLGLSSYLTGWGIDGERIREFDWWETAEMDGIEFVCTPAQHFSGRSQAHKNNTLWGSWVVRDKKQSLYYSGDSGYAGHFKAIGEKYGPFDISLISNGQYNIQWPMSHLHPEETGKAYLELKSRSLLPLHWGMFNISTHNWYDPIEDIDQIAKEKGLNLLTPMMGEIVYVGQTRPFEKWWKRLINKKD